MRSQGECTDFSFIVHSAKSHLGDCFLRNEQCELSFLAIKQVERTAKRVGWRSLLSVTCICLVMENLILPGKNPRNLESCSFWQLHDNPPEFFIVTSLVLLYFSTPLA